MNSKQPTSSEFPAFVITYSILKVTFLQDNVPELQEGFIINITDVRLLDSPTGGQPSVKRLGLEIAEITIEENDDARGVFSFNVTKVSLNEKYLK